MAMKCCLPVSELREENKSYDTLVTLLALQLRMSYNKPMYPRYIVNASSLNEIIIIVYY